VRTHPPGSRQTRVARFLTATSAATLRSMPTTRAPSESPPQRSGPCRSPHPRLAFPSGPAASGRSSGQNPALRDSCWHCPVEFAEIGATGSRSCRIVVFVDKADYTAHFGKALAAGGTGKATILVNQRASAHRATEQSKQVAEVLGLRHIVACRQPVTPPRSFACDS